MKIDWKKFLPSLAIPLGVGGLSALLSGGMGDYARLNQPPLSPPGWVFPVVWTILYLLMGYASYRVWVSGKDSTDIKNAQIYYGIQLFLNFLWPIFYFGFQWRIGAMVLLIFLWIAVLLTMRKFAELDETAGDLLIPYLLWITFAAYLNLGTILLN